MAAIANEHHAVVPKSIKRRSEILVFDAREPLGGIPEHRHDPTGLGANHLLVVYVLELGDSVTLQEQGIALDGVLCPVCVM